MIGGPRLGSLPAARPAHPSHRGRRFPAEALTAAEARAVLTAPTRTGSMAARGEHEAYSYEPFTCHRFYEAVNRSLVEEGVRRLAVPAARAVTVVDLSCGTGAMTVLVVEALRRRGLDATIVAVDPSPEALAQAERRLAGVGVEIRFLQGGAAELAGALPGEADALFFGNAIHLVGDKDRALREIAGVLGPGGVFAFNSSFFDGAYAAAPRSSIASGPCARCAGCAGSIRRSGSRARRGPRPAGGSRRASTRAPSAGAASRSCTSRSRRPAWSSPRSRTSGAGVGAEGCGAPLLLNSSGQLTRLRLGIQAPHQRTRMPRTRATAAAHLVGGIARSA
jgi:Methyltransferase domain